MPLDLKKKLLSQLREVTIRILRFVGQQVFERRVDISGKQETSSPMDQQQFPSGMVGCSLERLLLCCYRGSGIDLRVDAGFRMHRPCGISARAQDLRFRF